MDIFGKINQDAAKVILSTPKENITELYEIQSLGAVPTAFTSESDFEQTDAQTNSKTNDKSDLVC